MGAGPVTRRGIWGAGRPLARVARSCLTQRGVLCRTRGDGCPENAIRFRPMLRGLALPEIDPAACTACGACVPICPAAAISVGHAA